MSGRVGEWLRKTANDKEKKHRNNFKGKRRQKMIEAKIYVHLLMRLAYDKALENIYSLSLLTHLKGRVGVLNRQFAHTQHG